MSGAAARPLANAAMQLKCPICGKPVECPEPAGGIAGGAHFPFCSDRCKLIDLGRWLDGKYQIPVVDPDAEESDVPYDADR